MDQFTTRRSNSQGSLSINGVIVNFWVEYAPATRGLFTIIFEGASNFEKFDVLACEGGVLDVHGKYANRPYQNELLSAIEDFLKAENLI